MLCVLPVLPPPFDRTRNRFAAERPARRSYSGRPACEAFRGCSGRPTRHLPRAGTLQHDGRTGKRSVRSTIATLSREVGIGDGDDGCCLFSVSRTVRMTRGSSKIAMSISDFGWGSRGGRSHPLTRPGGLPPGLAMQRFLIIQCASADQAAL